MKIFKTIFLTVLIGSLLIFFRMSASGQGQDPGKDIFLKHKCNKCHALKAQNIEKLPKKTGEDSEEDQQEKSSRKPPDLSNVGLKRDAAWMVRWLDKKEKIKGKTHKKQFKGTDAEKETVAKWLETQKSTQYGDAK